MRITVLGTGPRARALAETLAELGHDAVVVAANSETDDTGIIVVGADLLAGPDLRSAATELSEHLSSLTAEPGPDGPRRLSVTRVGDLEARVERLTRRVAMAENSEETTRDRLEALQRRKSVRLALRVANWLSPLLRVVRAALGHSKQAQRSPSSTTSSTLRSREEVVAGIERHRTTTQPFAGPLVSIIILTRDGAHHLRRLLPCLVATTYESFEVIVVDNASTDHTGALLDRVWPFRLRVIRNSENASFALGNNQAADTARGEYLLFLNNDVEPIGDEWLGAMVAAAQADPAPAAVGALLVYPDRGDPATDFTVQHQGIVFELRDGAPRALNRKHPDPTSGTLTGVAEVPAATAAALMVAKETFDAVGGFTPGYVYGAEDVDLCLRLRPHGPIVVQRDAALFHHESASQTDDRGELRQTRKRNWRLFADTWGPTLTRSIRKDRVLGEGRWTTQQKPKVAITLTRNDPSFGFGDWYTAHELGDAFSTRGWAVHYAERFGDHWDEIPSDVGLIISLLDSYDVRTAPPEAFTIAWARNWVDRWLGRDWLDEYDLVVTGSHRAAAEFRERSRFDPPVVPLATNPERFAPGDPVAAHLADYSFTGNYWGVSRQIMTSLQRRDGETFGLYGRAWDQLPEAASDWRGSVDYDELSMVYRSARVVLDDTAGPTIDHGFINSRVFDALAAGALVISNNPLGSEEIFDGLLPTYSDPEELRELLDRFLSDDAARLDLAEQLRAIVVDHHTYPRRAEQFVELAVAEIDRPRIAIKIAAPTPERAELWGDTYFAQAMIRALRPHGFRGEIHLHPEWDLPTHQGADVAIQLRGHHTYDTKPSAINVMWLISHPDETTLEEFDRFDLVAVASTGMAEELAPRTDAQVVPMLQATDRDRFGPATPRPELVREVLFVGNSRQQHRIAVDWAIESGLPLTVFGTQWDGIIPDRYVEGTYFPNERLPDLYASAGVVLNDHWPDMRRRGFVSNRIFDVLAAGGFVVSDPVPGLDEMLDGAVPTFATREELVSVIEHYRDAPEERAALVERGRRIVLERHTFTHRAEELAALLRRLLQNRPADLDGTTF